MDIQTPSAVVSPASPPPTRRPLPRSVEQLLTWLNPQDYNKVETVLCGMPLTREILLAARFLDAVWGHARNAEYRVGSHRITGAEMDRFYQRFEGAMKELVSIGVELASRAGLTEITQRHKTGLGHHGFTSSGRPKVSEPAKAPPKAAEKDSPAKAMAVQGE